MVTEKPTIELKPSNAGGSRVSTAQTIRENAAKIAKNRVNTPPVQQQGNGEWKLDPPISTFTKSLYHDIYGIVNPGSYWEFINALSQGFGSSSKGSTKSTGAEETGTAASFKVPKHPAPTKVAKIYYTPLPDEAEARAWESPIAGHTYDLQGPDPDAVAMPPAPALGSDELTAEMAEVYAMALLRDIPFNNIEDGSSEHVNDIIAALNQLPWFSGDKVSSKGKELNTRETARRDARFLNGEEKKVTLENLFRGSTPGAQKGPYISQFLMIGNAARKPNPPGENPQTSPAASFASTIEPNDATNRPSQFASKGIIAASRGLSLESAPAEELKILDLEVKDGLIQYGAQLINQRLVPHPPGKDYMTDWASWIDVQNGADRRDFAEFGVEKDEDGEEIGLAPLGRFIHTPRDLATYVHYDALYQAYLNACLILLNVRAPADAGLPEGPASSTRAGFATFGDPHILTLVTEVATSALKAVRRQKFQIHLRARPEAIAGALTLGNHPKLAEKLDEAQVDIRTMLESLIPADSQDPQQPNIAAKLIKHNQEMNEKWAQDDTQFKEDWIEPANNLLLPMAFPEGSPVHGSYGAGHATVAGACTTVLKAFFEMYHVDDAIKPGETTLQAVINKSKDKSLFGTPKTLHDLKLLGEGEYYRTTALTDQSGRTYEGGALKLHKDNSSSNGTQGEKSQSLGIQDELDKLAANISIGRNFAGVHYYTDYYESLRMGERIAVGILQEQMLTYGEPVSMRFTSFDGDRILITGTGGTEAADAQIHIWDQDDNPVEEKAWWNRAMDEINQ